MNPHDGTIAPEQEAQTAESPARPAEAASAPLSGGLDVAELCRPVPLRTGLFWSLFGVWHRHYCVYRRTLLARGSVYVISPDQVPDGALMAAVLRY